jgi:hypothetical protein
MVYRPALLLFSPIIWFAFLGYGLSITFIVLIAVLSSYIFSLPPYNFGPESAGLIWLAAFIGTLIAALVLGPLSDLLVSSLSICSLYTQLTSFSRPDPSLDATKVSSSQNLDYP